MINALTVDVEEWFHANALHYSVDDWGRFESRVVPHTRMLLELFARKQVKGTFFIVGAVAEQHPELVVEIAAAGHEIGSHSRYHRLVSRLSDEEFRIDVRETKAILERISGVEVTLFRAPSWSLSMKRPELFRILSEEGYTCDSSLQPFATPLSGSFDIPNAPFIPVLGGVPLQLAEFPALALGSGPLRFPFAGGLYLRMLPYWAIAAALRRLNKQQPGMIYVHPWEFDLNMPRPAGLSPLLKLAMYHNVHTTYTKLERLLDQFSFAPLGTLLEERRHRYRQLAL